MAFENVFLAKNHLSLEISAKCNVNCIMCSLQKYYDNKGLMSLDTLENILPYIPHFNMIDLGFSGEPFMNPKILVFLKKIKFVNPDIYVQIITNGTLLSEKVIEELISLKIDEVMISMDGATKETYEQIRKGSNFNLVRNNINLLNRKKQEFDVKKPILTSTFVMMKENYHEIELFMDIINNLNFERLMINNVEDYDLKKYQTSLLKLKTQELQNTLSQIKLKAKKCSFEVLIPSLSNSNKKGCDYSYPLISWNGDVIPCAALSYKRPYYFKSKKHFYERLSFGNIHEKNFIDILMSENYLRFRNNLKKNVLNKECLCCLRSKGLICANKLL